MEPRGWVATANTRAHEGSASRPTPGNERLRKQAEGENGIFEELGFKDLLEQGRASHSALVAQLNKAFISHLKTTWVPATLTKLDERAAELKFKNLMMGMPEAHQSPPPSPVKDAIVKVGEKKPSRACMITMVIRHT